MGEGPSLPWGSTPGGNLDNQAFHFLSLNQKLILNRVVNKTATFKSINYYASIPVTFFAVSLVSAFSLGLSCGLRVAQPFFTAFVGLAFLEVVANSSFT